MNEPSIMGYILKPTRFYKDFRTTISSGAEQLLKSDKFSHLERQLTSAANNPRYNDLGINCMIINYLQEPLFHIFPLIAPGTLVCYGQKTDLSFLENKNLSRNMWFPKKEIKRDLKYIETVLYQSTSHVQMCGAWEDGFLIMNYVRAKTFYELYSTLSD